MRRSLVRCPDDTLWHNEPIFQATEAQFATLLAAYHSAEWIRSATARWGQTPAGV